MNIFIKSILIYSFTTKSDFKVRSFPLITGKFPVSKLLLFIPGSHMNCNTVQSRKPYFLKHAHAKGQLPAFYSA